MKNNKFLYYLINGLLLLIPRIFFRKQLHREISQLEQYDSNYILDRVNYYNKLTNPCLLDEKFTTRIRDFRKTKGWTYYFDLYSVLKYFSKDDRFCYLNGDVTKIPENPTFLKSRPISDENQNSVLLKLNKIRHFLFVDDTGHYRDKKDMIVWRGAAFQKHRKKVIESFYDHPQCEIGQVKPVSGSLWDKPYMSIKEQLNYKFILCIEGNDVATNLKWAMSSNSICIMSKPKFETWFMEGRLKSGVHYIEVKDDYSDMIEKINYYLCHEDEVLSIIDNANEYVSQFEDRKRERLIGLLVADKYFKCVRAN
jgi:ribosomal protein L30/L7E